MGQEASVSSGYQLARLFTYFSITEWEINVAFSSQDRANIDVLDTVHELITMSPLIQTESQAIVWNLFRFVAAATLTFQLPVGPQQVAISQRFEQCTHMIISLSLILA